MKLTTLAPNQTTIELANGTTVFFSYSTPVAAHVSGHGYFRTEEKFSVTTSKHINAWAGKTAPTRPQSFFTALVAA